MQDIAGEYRAQAQRQPRAGDQSRRPAAVLGGRVAAGGGDSQPINPRWSDALDGRDSISLLPQPNGILQVVTVPVAIGLTHPEILGTLSVGFLLDDALAAQLKTITGSDLAFGMDGQILAATLPRDDYPALADRLRAAGISRVRLGTQEYEALSRPLSAAGDSRTPSGPVALIPALPDRTAAVAAGDSHGPRRHGGARRGARDGAEPRRRAHDRASAGRDHRRDARSRVHRRPHA